MKTAKEYIDCMPEMNFEIHLFGERFTNHVDHSIIRPTMECIAATYELAEKPEYQYSMTATASHIKDRIIE